MAQVKNISDGPRGIYLKDGALVMVEPGRTVEGEFADVNDEWFEAVKAKPKADAEKAAA
jgi:hypothetical protein